MGLPRRDYSWPPFAPGNNLGQKFEAGNLDRVTHGAWSSRLVAERAVELIKDGTLPDFETLSAELPWLAPQDRFAVAAWLNAEARAERVREWLDENGVTDGEGNLRQSDMALLVRLERHAVEARDRLGLDPTSRARMLRDTASAAHSHAATSALGKVAAAGRAAREARQEAERAQIAQLPPGGAPKAENGPQVPEIGDPGRAADQEADDD